MGSAGYNDGRSITARGLKGKSLFTHRHRVPGIGGTGSLIAGLRQARAALQRTDCYDRAAGYIELFLLLAVGVDRHLGLTRTDRIDQTAFDIAISIGIDTVVAGRISAYHTTGDRQVIAGVDRIVGRLYVQLTTADDQDAVALDTFSAGVDEECAALEIDAVVRFDTFVHRRDRQCSGAGSKADIIVGAQAVLILAVDGQTAAAGHDELSFAEECSFAVLVRRGVRTAVRQAVGALEQDKAGFLALVIDRRPVRAGEGEAVEDQLMPVGAVDRQLSLSAAAEQIGDIFHGGVHRYVAVLAYYAHAVVRTRDSGARAIPYDSDRVHRRDRRVAGALRVSGCCVLRRVLLCAGNHPDCQEHQNPNLFHTLCFYQSK